MAESILFQLAKLKEFMAKSSVFFSKADPTKVGGYVPRDADGHISEDALPTVHVATVDDHEERLDTIEESIFTSDEDRRFDRGERQFVEAEFIGERGYLTRGRR